MRCRLFLVECVFFPTERTHSVGCRGSGLCLCCYSFCLHSLDQDLMTKHQTVAASWRLFMLYNHFNQAQPLSTCNPDSNFTCIAILLWFSVQPLSACLGTFQAKTTVNSISVYSAQTGDKTKQRTEKSRETQQKRSFSFFPTSLCWSLAASAYHK